jgi:tetratricopeptide (TPR) repeat protein
MIYPSNRYQASNARGFPERGNRGKWPYVGLVLVLAASAVTVSFILSDGRMPLTLNSGQDADDWSTLWEGGDYETLIQETDETLARSPMSGKALVFKGFSHFYRGINRVSSEDSEQEMVAATVSLRRALLLDEPPLAERVHYVLGKTYFHRGTFYYDLAVSHLEQASALGYTGNDGYEYLGLAHANLGNYDASVQAFDRAIERQPSALLYLVAAESYRKTGAVERARVYLESAITSSDDRFLIQEARMRLGDLFLTDDRLGRAAEQYQALLEENPRSAEAHYQLGLVYDRMGNRERARYEWREALRIDPSHSEALNRLQNN